MSQGQGGTLAWKKLLGVATNHVDHFLGIFDPLPPHVDSLII